MFKPDLSINKIIELLNKSPYGSCWIDFEGEKHSADLGYIYDFLSNLYEYLNKHPEHVNKLTIDNN